MSDLMKCTHENRYRYAKHYPAEDPKDEYDLCAQCGLLWRRGSDDPPFLHFGYYRSVFFHPVANRYMLQLNQ